MTFEEWKQKNYKMWNTEQAYMLACEGTPEEENAVDKYSKMIFEAAQPKWKDAQKEPPKEAGSYLCIWNNGFYNVQQACMYDAKTKMFITNTLFPVIAWMSLPEYKEQTK